MTAEKLSRERALGEPLEDASQHLATLLIDAIAL